jgi:small subunit ribosomal protein S2
LKGILVAKKMLAEIVSSGSDVVFVGTKRQAQKAVEKAAAQCQMHFVSERWLGGMLTNFRTIRSRLQRLEQLEAMEKDGSLEKESKKQASRLKREMRKIRTNLDGVRKMTRLPGMVVVVDAKKEYLALCEANKLGIPTIGVLDTDSDPDTVDIVIPANDDSIRAVDVILQQLADAVAIGKTLMGTKPQVAGAGPGPGARRSRSSRPVLARASDAGIDESPVEPFAASAPMPEPEPAADSADAETSEAATSNGDSESESVAQA